MFAGKLEAAIENLANISLLSVRMPVAEWVASELVSIGEIDRAMIVAKDLFDLSYQSSVIANVAKHVYDSSNLDSALEYVQSIPDPETRCATFLQFCRSEAFIGDCHTANRIAKKIDFPSFRARALLAVAECYEKRCSELAPLNIFSDVFEIAHKVEDHLVRSSIFLELANSLIVRGENERAKPIIKLAASFASMVVDPLKSLEALLNCGIVQASIFDFASAKKTAKDVAFALEYVDWRLGDAWALRGKLLAFSIVAGECLDEITCDDAPTKFPDLNDILEASYELATAGLKEDATALAERAVALVPNLDPSDFQAFVGGFSYASIIGGDLDHAIEIAKKVEKIHGSIGITITDVCGISELMAKKIGREHAINYLQSEAKKISLIPLKDQEFAYETFLKTQRVICDEVGIEENLKALERVPLEYRSGSEEAEDSPLKLPARALAEAISERDWTQARKILESIETISDQAEVLATALGV